MLDSMTRILSGLNVNEERISENLMKFKDPMMSESLMIALISKGMLRQEAHKLLQQLIVESQDKHKGFGETLAASPVVAKYLTREEINSALDPRSYLGMSEKLVDAAVDRAVAERQARGLAA
jgi:adenylosuccinate lyase